MPSTESPPPSLNQEERRLLLELALDSIEYGLEKGVPLPVTSNEYSAALQHERASFVTLQLAGELRGCIGHLEAIQSAVKDVADNAFAAAFRDPRFSPVTDKELPRIDIHISLLTPAVNLKFESEEDLIQQLKPGIDGLILRQGMRQGTFLPSVWEQLPDPRRFLQHLKLKAGLSADSWSDHIKVKRYRTESFS